MLNQPTTIAAIATPPGKGGVGIVRLSGSACRQILEALVPDWPTDFPSHKLRLSRIYDWTNSQIDESLVVFMKGPHSYTGEDVVEFQCHGGPIILRRVLECALHHGANVAEPGEFTQRAFMNGRLDLTQAEAVADLINASSVAAHKLAMDHLQGHLGKAIRSLLDHLVDAAVLVEAAIDFSHEEHVYQIERDEVQKRVQHVYGELEKLRRQFDEGRRQREGIKTVILGPTNAGKSTLFNLLHGSERAIVTDIAGTTRDFIEEEIHIGGVALRIIDTAGLRLTDNKVEVIGIERSRQLGQQADLVLWLVDQSVGIGVDDKRELEQLFQNDRPTVVIINKSDQPDRLSEDDKTFLNRFYACIPTALGTSPPQGMEDLLHVLKTLGAELTSGEGVLLSRARHLECVVRAMEALIRTQDALEAQLDHEFIALDVREALDALGDIIGRVSTDDILQRIFSDFCVGK